MQLHEASNYTIIDELQKTGLLDEKWARKLKLAVAVVAVVRLKMYSSSKGQDDFIKNQLLETTRRSAFHEVIEEVGAKPLLAFLTSLFYIQAKVTVGYVSDNALLQ